MKKIALLFIFTLLLVTPVFAQEDDNVVDKAPEITDVEGLRAEFKQYIQSAENREIKFEMILKSNLDSDRVKITWSLTTLSGNGAIFVNPAQTIKYITIKKGETYTFPITILPTGKGVVELLGKAQSFKAGESFTVTAKKEFATNIQQEILPITSEFRSQKLLVMLKNFLIFVVLVVAGIYLLLKGSKWFKRWLNK